MHFDDREVLKGQSIYDRELNDTHQIENEKKNQNQNQNQITLLSQFEKLQCDAIHTNTNTHNA